MFIYFPSDTFVFCLLMLTICQPLSNVVDESDIVAFNLHKA